MSNSIEPLPSSETDGSALSTRLNPLVCAADPILLAVALLADGTPPGSPGLLQQRLLDALDDFSDSIEHSHPQLLDDARYALSALIDETILSTAWGASSWAQFSLLAKLFDEEYSGEFFFERLEKACALKDKGVLLLEFFHLCLSVGYCGRFHRRRYTAASIQQLRTRIASLITQYRTTPQPPLNPPLSITAKKKRPPLPLWITAVFLGALTLGLHQGLSTYLAGSTDSVLDAIKGIGRTAAGP